MPLSYIEMNITIKDYRLSYDGRQPKAYIDKRCLDAMIFYLVPTKFDMTIIAIDAITTKL